MVLPSSFFKNVPIPVRRSLENCKCNLSRGHTSETFRVGRVEITAPGGIGKSSVAVDGWHAIARDKSHTRCLNDVFWGWTRIRASLDFICILVERPLLLALTYIEMDSVCEEGLLWKSSRIVSPESPPLLADNGRGVEEEAHWGFSSPQRKSFRADWQRSMRLPLHVVPGAVYGCAIDRCLCWAGVHTHNRHRRVIKDRYDHNEEDRHRPGYDDLLFSSKLLWSLDRI